MNDDFQLDPPDHVFIAIARIGGLVLLVVTLWLGVGVLVGAPG